MKLPRLVLALSSALLLLWLHAFAAGQSQFLTFPLPDASTPVYHGWFYPNGEKHYAVDYKAVLGTDAFAAADGLAISSCQPPLTNSDSTPDTYGNFVLIDHRNGFSTLYAHLSSISLPAESQLPCDNLSRRAIQAGNIQYGGLTYSWAVVKRGDPIGKVGQTGTTYLHLHFEAAGNNSGSYADHVANKIDPYAIYLKAAFYPPPASKCSNVRIPGFMWTACPPVQALPPAVTFMKAIGSTGDDFASSIQRTSDGGFIIAGNTTGLGAGGQDVLLVKLDGSGAIQWAKTAGTAGSEVAYSARQTSDGGYIVSGSTDGVTGVAQILVAKFDGSGAFQWASALGDPSDSAAGLSAQQTTDGGYIATGFPGGAIGGLGLLKYDSTGQLQWLRRAVGTNLYGNSVQQTSDGGYIVAGTKQINAYDLTLLKFDGSGNLQWAQLAGGNGNESGNAVQQTSDGGYIVAGATASFGAGGQDALLLKYDNSGALQWARTAGGSGNDEADSVQQTSDGGYIVSGRTASFGPGETTLLLKYDGSGTLQWARAGGGSTSGSSVRQTSDGSYIVAASTASFGAGGSDILLIRTDGNGNIAGCSDWSSVSPSIGTTLPSAATSYSVDSPSFSIGAPSLTVAPAPLTPNNKCP